MRLAHALFLGSMAALLTLAAPTLARNSNQPKASEAPASSSCHAYQQAPDGTWKQLPCQAIGFQGTAAAEVRIEGRRRRNALIDERRERSHAVIASETKQSMVRARKHGLLRRGACPRARIRATRGLLAMTACVEPRPMQKTA